MNEIKVVYKMISSWDSLSWIQYCEPEISATMKNNVFGQLQFIGALVVTYYKSVTGWALDYYSLLIIPGWIHTYNPLGLFICNRWWWSSQLWRAFWCQLTCIWIGQILLWYYRAEFVLQENILYSISLSDSTGLSLFCSTAEYTYLYCSGTKLIEFNLRGWA